MKNNSIDNQHKQESITSDYENEMQEKVNKKILEMKKIIEEEEEDRLSLMSENKESEDIMKAAEITPKKPKKVLKRKEITKKENTEISQETESLLDLETKEKIRPIVENENNTTLSEVISSIKKNKAEKEKKTSNTKESQNLTKNEKVSEEKKGTIVSKKESIEDNKTKIDEVKKEIEVNLNVNQNQEKNSKVKEIIKTKKINTPENDIFIENNLRKIGLKNTDLENNTTWQNLTKEEKLLIIQLASQDTLSQVKDLGQKRFEEENSIKLSWNPMKWKTSIIKKTWNNIRKPYWISKAEKNIINEVEGGQIKPRIEVLESLIQRQADLNLNVVEKNGKAVIEFIQGDKLLSKQEQEIINRFNDSANAFSVLPDSWKNEKSAKSTDKIFAKENYKKYEESKLKYEKEKGELLESLEIKYKNEGLSNLEAKEKAMLEVKNIDFQVSMMQFTNTNPDSLEELNKIRNESSWGRLVNNENIWKSIYMGTGYTLRSATYSTLGLLAAPLTAGAIGGIRARRKANENINKAFKEGSKDETFLERREEGKKGLYDDKNKDLGLIKASLSGRSVNTKEVAAFIDADNQKQRIENLIGKINNTQNESVKALLKAQLSSRISYIEQKQAEGLVNYGSKNSISKNYELFKALSEAYILSSELQNNDKPSEEIQEEISERKSLLKSIMTKNEVAFGKEIASYKNKETLRGAAVAAGFAVLGRLVRDYLHETNTKIITNQDTINEIPKGQQHHINEVLLKTKENPIKSVETITTVKHGDGGIVLARKLQNELKLKYGSDLSKAPESVKHIINTDAHKIAKEFKMYRPDQDKESALLHEGDFITEKDGNINFHDKFTGKEVNLMKGGSVKPIHTYEGKMSDTDHLNKSIKTEVAGEKDLIKNTDTIEHNTNEDTKGILTNEKVASIYKDPNELIKSDTQERIINTTQKSVSETLETNTDKLKEVKDAMISSESITEETLKRVNLTIDENIKHLFPNDKLMGQWSYIKTYISADKLIKIGKEGINDDFKPLISYIDKLQEVSGLKPIEKTVLAEAETVPDYILRASKRVAELGQLDKIKI